MSLETFLNIPDASRELLQETAKILATEGVTVDMIVNGTVTAGELAEIDVDQSILDQLPRLIEDWKQKVRIRNMFESCASTKRKDLR